MTKQSLWRDLVSKRLHAKIILPIVFVVAIAALILPNTAQAGILDSVVGLINYVVYAIDALLGSIFALLVEVLIFVAQYNNFTNEPAIATAWVLLRDIANMGFVVIIVVVGFAQMFDLSKVKNMANLNLAQFLPKLVIGVLLINFSKGIVGLLIDLSQIITLTFVAAFKDVAASNLIGGLQLGKIFSGGFAVASGQELNMFFLLMMVMIIMAIAIIIVAMITALFVTRIVAFWLLTIFSPLMFAASVYPVQGIKRFYGQWWDKFSGYLMMGPSLAFMVWLAFLILQNTTSIGVATSQPTAMAEPTVAGQYVANAQVSTTNVKNLAASASNPTQTGIPGMDFTTILGFVMGAGALVSTIFVAQMSKLAGSKEIGGAAMGALKTTGAKAYNVSKRIAAGTRQGVYAGAQSLARLGSKKVELKDDKGNVKLDSKGGPIMYRPDNEVSRTLGFVAEHGFAKTGKKAVENIQDAAKKILWKGYDKHMENYGDFKEGKRGGLAGIATAIAHGLYEAKTPEQLEKRKTTTKNFDEEALNSKNIELGQKAKSYNDFRNLAFAADTKAKRAALGLGGLDNKNLTEDQRKEIIKTLKNDVYESKDLLKIVNMEEALLTGDFDGLKKTKIQDLAGIYKDAQATLTEDANNEVALDKKQKVLKAITELNKQGVFSDVQVERFIKDKVDLDDLDAKRRRDETQTEFAPRDEISHQLLSVFGSMSAAQKALKGKIKGSDKDKNDYLSDFDRRRGGKLEGVYEEDRQKDDAAMAVKLEKELAAADDEHKKEIATDVMENGGPAETAVILNDNNLTINALNNADPEKVAQNMAHLGESQQNSLADAMSEVYAGTEIDDVKDSKKVGFMKKRIQALSNMTRDGMDTNDKIKKTMRYLMGDGMMPKASESAKLKAKTVMENAESEWLDMPGSLGKLIQDHQDFTADDWHGVSEFIGNAKDIKLPREISKPEDLLMLCGMNSDHLRNASSEQLSAIANLDGKLFSSTYIDHNNNKQTQKGLIDEILEKRGGNPEIKKVVLEHKEQLENLMEQASNRLGTQTRQNSSQSKKKP